MTATQRLEPNPPVTHSYNPRAVPRTRRLATRLSRITTSGTYIAEIDGLRFVAIASVFLFHVAINLPARNMHDYNIEGNSKLLYILLKSGDFGVQAFFVISGFVLAIPFARHALLGARKVRLKSYYSRRVTRLEPPYFVAMIGSLALLVIVHKESLSSLLPHLFAGFLYSHNIVYGNDNIINNVAWSLEVEIQFYLLVPLFASMFLIKRAALRRLAVVGAILVFAAVGPALAGTSPHLHNTILRFGQYFLSGFVLADLFVSDQLKPSRRSGIWDSLTVIAALVIVTLHISIEQTPLPPRVPAFMDSVYLCLLPFACIAAYSGVFRGKVFRRILTIKWITIIGGMCYSIYLLHNVILGYGLSITKDFVPTGAFLPDFAFQITLMVILVLFISIVFFLLIERPCMDKTWPLRLYRWAQAKVSGRDRHRPDVEPVTKDLKSSQNCE